MRSPHILLIVTSASAIGKKNQPTGYWLEEVVAPYYTFIDAHCRVTVASPLGGRAPIAPESLTQEAATAATRRYQDDEVLQALLADTYALADLDMAQYQGFFFAGGHGAMVDFPNNSQIAMLIARALQEKKPVASVCHGPACLVGAKDANGNFLIKNRRFTCFSNVEERHIEQEKLVPFMLESMLVEQGGIAKNAGIFEANVVTDGALITGQNPASSIGTAEAVIHQLRQRLAA